MNADEHRRAALDFAEGRRSWWNLHAPHSGEPGLSSQALANNAVHDLCSMLMHSEAARLLASECREGTE
jgi:hypothetical protein